MDNLVKEWGRYSPYFREGEFVCKCKKCEFRGVAFVHEVLMDMLYMARRVSGVPFVIVSGGRCEEHNSIVKGTGDSDHLVVVEGVGNVIEVKKLCSGVDIRVQNSRERYQILYGLLSVGFTRIGIGGGFIHVGLSDEKVGGVVWTY